MYQLNTIRGEWRMTLITGTALKPKPFLISTHQTERWAYCFDRSS